MSSTTSCPSSSRRPSAASARSPTTAPPAHPPLPPPPSARPPRRADHVLTLSEHARGQIVERLGIPADGVTAIHCAVDHDRFTPVPDEHDAALPTDLPERFVLYPANLWPHKN